ncbi:wings apart-like protein regulation of heterochromatin-domain-containing protein [Xylaria sp. CBS 124048]|nr:wings apart-like protein regulation of heterochromatin-domain-containing protein [Xylaria sp. CBS 124048]
MGPDHEVDELGALRKRPILKNTYGKGPRRRQSKAAFTPATESESMSEEDPIVASNSTVGRHQPSLSLPSPKSKLTSGRLQGPSGSQETQTIPGSFQEIASSTRKRKISQIYKSRERSQPVAGESEGESAPSAPEPRRSRLAQSASMPAVKPGRREHTHTRASSSGSIVVELVRSRVSNPPSSSPQVIPKSVKPVSSHVSGQKPANAPSTESTQKHTTQRQQRIPLHLTQDHTRKKKPPIAPSARAKEQSLPVSTNKSPDAKLPKNTRRRLIDILVEQEEQSVTTNETLQASQTSSTSELDHQGSPETPKAKSRKAPVPGARTFRRKLLEEEDTLLESFALPETSSYSRRLDLGGYKKPTSGVGGVDYGNDDVTTSGSPTGANSRKPGTSASSSRRTALFQVAEKIRDKVFILQCRDHGVESVLLKDIAKETDAICGFLILSSLVTIIAKGPSAHMCQLLCAEQPGPIFARLLSIHEDIKKLAKDRKSNLSKRNQSLIGTIENNLQNLPIWDGNQPSFITPRSLATKCLQLLIAQDILIGSDPRVFTEPVTGHLFKILSDASNNTEYFDYPKSAQSTELCSALSVLNVHAVSVATTQGSDDESTLPNLPIIADVLYASLQMPAQNDKTIEDLILKLTINLTNNNLAAPGIFASKGLLPTLAASICNNFNQALTHISQDTWTEGILNSLYLQLGILINFAEHSDLARQILNECSHENRDLVKELIKLFTENHYRTSEADSMEKSHLNVAFGYLAVLLGYLALYKPVRQKLVRTHSTRSIRPLIGTIREFIAHYEQVENAISETDDDRHHGGYTERLRELTRQLEDKAARD